MHVSLSHGEKCSSGHSPAALWVHSVSTRGFEVAHVRQVLAQMELGS